MKAQLIVPAAGLGRRLGHDTPKALVEVCGTPLLVHTLRRFLDTPLGHRPIVTMPVGWEAAFSEALARGVPGMDCCLTPGGKERQDSVEAALALLDPSTEIAAVHDAARPFVSTQAIADALAAAEAMGAATVAIPAVDTILEADADGLLVHTPPRARLWACQTPQVFRVAVLRAAHEAARRHGWTVTDDASLVHRTGHPVRLVMGSRANIKVTTAADLELAACMMREGLA